MLRADLGARLSVLLECLSSFTLIQAGWSYHSPFSQIANRVFAATFKDRSTVTVRRSPFTRNGENADESERERRTVAELNVERDQNMKREPRITLPIKKPAKVDKLEPQWRFWIWYFLLTLLVLWGWQELANQVQFRTIPYSQFKTYLAQHEITEAVVKQDEIDGRIVPRAEHETKNTPAEHGSPTASPEATQQPPADAKPFFFRTERDRGPGARE